MRGGQALGEDMPKLNYRPLILFQYGTVTLAEVRYDSSTSLKNGFLPASRS